MKKLIKYVLCMLGYHTMRFKIYKTKFGIVVGDKCVYCGMWDNEVRMVEKIKD